MVYKCKHLFFRPLKRELCVIFKNSMAEYTENLQSFKTCLPYLEMDSNLELINQFGELNPSVLENHTLGLQSFLGFSNENSLVQQQPSQFPINFSHNLQLLFDSPDMSNATVVPVVDQSMASAEDLVLTHGSNKRMRKTTTISDSNSSGNSSTPVSEIGVVGDNKNKRKNSSCGRGKKGRNNEKQVEKPKEVIHVRARRGQATDSHSLAERVRREKINERLRCLQHLVPGCYKTMGMAVMLDEIINYVQSLQNQVEFLSMKLTAASSFYDFNLDIDQPTQTMQGTNAYEAHEMERLVREGYGGLTFSHSTWPL